MGAGLHTTVPLQCQLSPERETWSETYEGTIDEIAEAAAGWIVGNEPSNPYEPLCTDAQDRCVIVQSHLTRKEGMLAELSVAYAYIRKVENWSCDMAEISKDIKTWLATEKGGFTEASAAVELAKIAQWEAFKDNGDFTRWQNFQYDEHGNVLTGTTLKLAHKIMKGVANYSIYAPVVTKTTQWDSPPPLENYGKVEAPTVRTGWTVIGGTPNWAGKANYWVKTACRSTPNGDGTYSLIEQWTGMDEVDGDLYGAAVTVTPPAEQEGGV